MKRRRPRFALSISEGALTTMRRYSEDASPNETGGLLIGHREGDTVVVSSVVEVPDPNATHTGYERQEPAAQDALDHARSQCDASEGYVGDWHSHPAPAQPSPQDLSSLKRVARQFKHPVGLVVLAKTSTGFDRPYSAVAKGRCFERLTEDRLLVQSDAPDSSTKGRSACD